MVEQYASWNDEIGEWQLRCVAYTGNNMRRISDTGDAERPAQVRCTLLEPATGVSPRTAL